MQLKINFPFDGKYFKTLFINRFCSPAQSYWVFEVFYNLLTNALIHCMPYWCLFTKYVSQGIEKIAWDASGERLALSYKDGHEMYGGLIAVYDIKRAPLISASLVLVPLAFPLAIIFFIIFFPLFLWSFGLISCEHSNREISTWVDVVGSLEGLDKTPSRLHLPSTTNSNKDHCYPW